MNAYQEYINKLINGLEDYHRAKTEDDELEALRFLSDTAEDLALDTNDEADLLEERLDNEALIQRMEQEEAYRGQY